MYPHERSLVKQLADKPFAIIGVNSDSDLEEIREIVKEKNLTWRSFQNEQEYGAISDLWAIRGWPTIFILDAEGTIRYRDVRGSEMDEAIEELLAEMGHEVKIVHEKKKPKKKAKNDAKDETGTADDPDVTNEADASDKLKADNAKDVDKAKGDDQSQDADDDGR